MSILLTCVIFSSFRQADHIMLLLRSSQSNPFFHLLLSAFPWWFWIVCKLKETSQNTISPKQKRPRDCKCWHPEYRLFQPSVWMFHFCNTCLTRILPQASSFSFFCCSSGISGLLHGCFCHPRNDSWEPLLCRVLPWLLSPTAVWVSQLSPYLPTAPASSAAHCAKCEVIKTQKTPALSWKEGWKAHMCQQRQHAANFALFLSTSRVCQLLCGCSSSGM